MLGLPVPATPDERAANGRAARSLASRSAQATWQPPADRADPVGILRAQEAMRVPELVPIRHGRMLVSPFTFLPRRGGGDGRRPRGDAADRPARAAVRRCAPVELRWVRVARTRARVRPQRLRRDVAGAVRVGRQAARREHRDRRPRTRLRRRRAPGGGDRDGRARTARRCSDSPGWATSTSGTPSWTSTTLTARARMPSGHRPKQLAKAAKKAHTKDSMQALSQAHP